jgi:orotate phosphoribosyltransferase
MSLFNLGAFTLHSGKESFFKIDCDALSDDDIDAIVHILAPMLEPFGEVVGIPRGGIRLAEAFKTFRTQDCTTLLVCDDVLTTGRSMNAERIQHSDGKVIGAVIFARTPAVPLWITPLFRMGDEP